MRTEVLARGVSPERAWAWWTDYREGAEDHAFAAWAKPDRRVEEQEDGTLRITEAARVGPFRYLEASTLSLAKPRIRFDMRNNVGRFRGTYRFLADAEGTRLEVVWEQELTGPLRWLGPLATLLLKVAFRWDLRHHVRQMEREAGRGPGGAGGARGPPEGS